MSRIHDRNPINGDQEAIREESSLWSAFARLPRSRNWQVSRGLEEKAEEKKERGECRAGFVRMSQISGKGKEKKETGAGVEPQ